ncbi:hypothetical protein VOLCADRAFT_91455 [Volvox carteri f. nagariensis]|uniref:Uncharacterized protein n=1 Tax=Volvox carteri f. nagariensis TaxID=3068 RepID=D8TX47_VOLCA|nr:uncharacterized protein VOLCADRAFT_91455 [Volvox carteri f. nagariensis]EFJ47948.1 hypothetical protein VOLCADRAFT_91455 [Volvox carteri f. nagariensis]|eukprot:XP_002951054.1 hypothetical protein VOLCADRAFT_91455 [Volvox carteri f. nagariensis]
MDAIAFRTRARFKEPASQACDKKLQAATLISQRSRRRLRRTVASESQHEHLNNNNSPAPTSDDEQNDSVASNEIRSPDGGGQGKPAGSRNRRRCVVSPPTTSASSDDSDVVIVGEFQSNDRDGAASQQQAKRPCIRQPSPKIAVNKPPLSDKPEDGDDLESDEELRIVGMVGQVVTRDLAHPRPHCAEHHFDRDMAAVESNAKCCEQCYCFVCDVKASECQFWGTALTDFTHALYTCSGRRQRDHANARPHPGWNALRQAARAGDKALVRREFEGEGPLLSLPQVAAAATIPREMYSQQELRQLLQQQQQTAALLLSRLMQQQQSGAQRQRALETGRGGGGGGGGAMEIAATADLDFGSHVDAFLAMLSFGRPATTATATTAAVIVCGGFRAAVQTQAEQTRKAQTQTRPHFQTHMSDIRTQMGIMMQPPQPQPSSSFPYRQPPWMVTGQNPGAADISGRLRQVAAATASAAAAAAGAGGGGGGGLMLQNLQKNAVNGPIVGTMAGTAAAAAAATPPSASVPVPICLQHVPELPWTAVNLSPSTSPQGPLRSHPPAPV